MQPEPQVHRPPGIHPRQDIVEHDADASGDAAVVSSSSANSTTGVGSGSGGFGGEYANAARHGFGQHHSVGFKFGGVNQEADAPVKIIRIIDPSEQLNAVLKAAEQSRYFIGRHAGNHEFGLEDGAEDFYEEGFDLDRAEPLFANNRDDDDWEDSDAIESDADEDAWEDASTDELDDEFDDDFEEELDEDYDANEDNFGDDFDSNGVDFPGDDSFGKPTGDAKEGDDKAKKESTD